MSTVQISRKLEQAVLRVYNSLIQIIDTPNWQDMSEELLWHELVACILGSKVAFEQAQAAADYLNTHGLLDLRAFLNKGNDFETQIVKALSNPISCHLNRPSFTFRYRYPKLRANHIRRTADSIYGKHRSIRSLLESSNNSNEARFIIFSNSIGVGPKQSSLFLRNIGYADNLAILDTHVLHYMFLLGILPTRTQAVKTIGDYEKLEAKFCDYTYDLGCNTAYLDTAVWITMRVYRRGQTT